MAKDQSKAVQWYAAAAAQGHAEAQYYLGRFALQSAIVSLVSLILNWRSLGASAGMCYAKGEGVTKDESKAVHWYEAAAAQGYVDAQFSLGMCFFRRLWDDLAVCSTLLHGV